MRNVIASVCALSHSVMSNSLQPHGLVACQAPLSMEILHTRDLPNSGIKPMSPTLQANSLPSEPPRKPLYSMAKHKLSHFGHLLQISSVLLRFSPICQLNISLVKCLTVIPDNLSQNTFIL